MADQTDARKSGRALRDRRWDWGPVADGVGTIL